MIEKIEHLGEMGHVEGEMIEEIEHLHETRGLVMGRVHDNSNEWLPLIRFSLN
jgi:hypothetical protein